MSPRLELEAAQDDVGAWAAANPSRIGIHATGAKALAYRPQLLALWEDKSLSEHLAQADRLDAWDDAGRRAITDKHIAEAVEMVQANLQNQIDAGTVDKAVADQLLAIFERIESVALECSVADLMRAAA